MVAGNGTYSSAPFVAVAPGTYRWIASYSGDPNNNTATTACNDSNESSVVSKTSPTIKTQATPTASTGGTISDTATLSGATATATGTITFNLYGPTDSTCGSAPIATSSAVVAGNGTYSSAPFVAVAPGTYRWIASYSGDPNNNTATTACNDSNESSVVSAGACPENDGGGDIKDNNSDKHAGDNRDAHFNSDQDDNNQCDEQDPEEVGETPDQDQQQIDSHDNRDGSDFHSTKIDSIEFSQLGKKATMLGSGVHAGKVVTFVVVEVDNGPSAPGFFSLQLSDGYNIAGNLIDGAINLNWSAGYSTRGRRRSASPHYVPHGVLRRETNPQRVASGARQPAPQAALRFASPPADEAIHAAKIRGAA